ncbi:MAG: histidine phosphatase family protein [Myxococcota bacterium]|nr:histidine phosphatase family protein [Myxococcota bacterium]
MKRTLLLMRHAKSAWNNANLTDHERPLNARGRRDAPAIGQYLAQLNLGPSRAFISDARRTMETFEHMWTFMPEIVPDYASDLYLADRTAIQRRCAGLPTSCARALMLGHNPGWSAAVGWLSGVHVELKTACIAVLDSDHDTWADSMQPQRWTLTRVITPTEAHSAL